MRYVWHTSAADNGRQARHRLLRARNWAHFGARLRRDLRLGSTHPPCTSPRALWSDLLEAALSPSTPSLTPNVTWCSRVTQ